MNTSTLEISKGTLNYITKLKIVRGINTIKSKIRKNVNPFSIVVRSPHPSFLQPFLAIQSRRPMLMLRHVPLLGIPNKATVVLADILFPTHYYAGVNKGYPSDAV